MNSPFVAITSLFALLFLTVTLNAQDYYCSYGDYLVFGSDTLNRTTNDLKEGPWWEFEIGAESMSCFASDTCFDKKYVNYVSSKGEYRGGLKTGKWTTFYPDSSVASEANYLLNGELHGTLKEYRPDGSEKTLRLFNNGDLVLGIEFYDEAQVKFLGKYSSGKLSEFIIYADEGRIKSQGEQVHPESFAIKNLQCFDEKMRSVKCAESRFDLLMLSEGLEAYYWLGP